MARYARRFRRGRRGNRSLSTRRIFNNKSAKAQAGQIYALKKRVSRMYNSLKPEVKISESADYSSNRLMPSMNETWYSFAFQTPGTGTGEENRIGSRIRIIQPTVFLSAKYNRITHSNAGQTIYNLNTGNAGCGMRVIAIQSKTALNAIPTLQEILHDPPATVSLDTASIANLKIPFEVGISTQFHILYDKIFYFSQDKTVLAKRINFRPRMRYMDWNVAYNGDTGYVYPAGMIFWYVVQGGLSTVGGDLDQVDHDELTITHTQKLAFTDV